MYQSFKQVHCHRSNTNHTTFNVWAIIVASTDDCQKANIRCVTPARAIISITRRGTTQTTNFTIFNYNKTKLKTIPVN